MDLLHVSIRLFKNIVHLVFIILSVRFTAWVNISMPLKSDYNEIRFGFFLTLVSNYNDRNSFLRTIWPNFVQHKRFCGIFNWNYYIHT